MSPQDVRSVEGRQMFSLEGEPVLVASLAEALGFRDREPLAPGARVPAVIVGGAGAIIVTALWAWMFPELRNADQLPSVESERKIPAPLG